MSDSGVLIVCATPIGNLGDVTFRVLDALRDADIIEAEDTRVTRKLLARYDIHTPLEAYHARNLEVRTPVVVERVARGQRVALASDAGTPGISDPGAHLVDACLEAGLRVEVLPGASAIISALVASGLPTYAFYFGGFLPRKAGERTRELEKLAALDATLVFYESPRRTAATLAGIASVLPGRRAAMARELTKVFEEVTRDEVGALAASLATRELKGEVVLLVGPPLPGGPAEVDDSDIRARLGTLMAGGASRKDAVKLVAEQTGTARNDVYRIALGD
ncbi:MAG: 16S rRNA (cytidine(1402)-2'-O)-methyltransferase [Coriobacteriia bacterium]|nr:16S rRNA (cytidine(1402)-2'-O)-methyltransferase [Coriobacteriia bacterium]